MTTSGEQRDCEAHRSEAQECAHAALNAASTTSLAGETMYEPDSVKNIAHVRIRYICVCHLSR